MTPARRPLAIVTVGTRGIGLGIARALARDGWNLAVCGLRSHDAVRDAIEDLESAGAAVFYHPLDVSRTVLENMRTAAPQLTDSESRSVLGSFLFPETRSVTTVAKTKWTPELTLTPAKMGKTGYGLTAFATF